MTWAEFQLRLFAYNRMDKQRRIELFHLTRTIVAVAPYLKGTDKNKIIKENKKIILGEEESKNRSLNSFQREIIKRAQQKALKDKQNGRS